MMMMLSNSRVLVNNGTTKISSVKAKKSTAKVWTISSSFFLFVSVVIRLYINGFYVKEIYKMLRIISLSLCSLLWWCESKNNELRREEVCACWKRTVCSLSLSLSFVKVVWLLLSSSLSRVFHLFIIVILPSARLLGKEINRKTKTSVSFFLFRVLVVTLNFSDETLSN